MKKNALATTRPARRAAQERLEAERPGKVASARKRKGGPVETTSHFHRWVRSDGQSEILCHDHVHFGPPHEHVDDAGGAMSPSMLNKLTAEMALEDFNRRIGA